MPKTQMRLDQERLYLNSLSSDDWKQDLDPEIEINNEYYYHDDDLEILSNIAKSHFGIKDRQGNDVNWLACTSEAEGKLGEFLKYEYSQHANGYGKYLIRLNVGDNHWVGAMIKNFYDKNIKANKVVVIYFDSLQNPECKINKYLHKEIIKIFGEYERQYLPETWQQAGGSVDCGPFLHENLTRAAYNLHTYMEDDFSSKTIRAAHIKRIKEYDKVKGGLFAQKQFRNVSNIDREVFGLPTAKKYIQEDEILCQHAMVIVNKIVDFPVLKESMKEAFSKKDKEAQDYMGILRRYFDESYKLLTPHMQESFKSLKGEIFKYPEEENDRELKKGLDISVLYKVGEILNNQITYKRGNSGERGSLKKSKVTTEKNVSESWVEYITKNVKGAVNYLFPQ